MPFLHRVEPAARVPADPPPAARSSSNVVDHQPTVAFRPRPTYTPDGVVGRFGARVYTFGLSVCRGERSTAGVVQTAFAWTAPGRHIAHPHYRNLT